MALNIPLPQPQQGGISDVAKAINAFAENNLKKRLLEVKNQEGEIANAFSQEVNPYKIQEAELKAKYPLLSTTGAAGQVESARYINDNPKIYNALNAFTVNPNSANSPNSFNNSPDGGGNPANLILKNIDAEQQLKEAKTQSLNTRTKNIPWSSLGEDIRSNIIAQGLAWGVDPMEMQDLINSGKSLKEIKKIRGLPEDYNPPPIYGPTTATKSKVQANAQTGAELEYLQNSIQKYIKPYANTFGGISAQKWKDTFSKDPEKQRKLGEYFGALTLQNELASGQIKLVGGTAGVKMVEGLSKKLLSGIDQSTPFKWTPEMYEGAQYVITKELKKGLQIRNAIGMNPYSNVFGNNNQNNAESNQDALNSSNENENIRTWNRQAGRFE